MRMRPAEGAIVARVGANADGPRVGTPRAGKRPSRSLPPLIVFLLSGSAFAALPARADEPPPAGVTTLPPEAVDPANGVSGGSGCRMPRRRRSPPCRLS